MFLEQFGFEESSVQPNGELVLMKSLVAPASLESLTPLQFNIRYGPRNTWLDGVKKYVVPIQPRFHRTLFPDIERQKSLFPGHFACGNSILKAYIAAHPFEISKKEVFSYSTAPRTLRLFAQSELSIVPEIIISRRTRSIRW